jgi:hypothetical protein
VYWLLGTSVQKEILWLVIVSLFLSARGNSGIEIVGESFSTTRENKEVLAADSHERHAQAAGEAAKDNFRHDATSWMDLVSQQSSRICNTASGSPAVVMVESTHDRKSVHLLACVRRGKS